MSVIPLKSGSRGYLLVFRGGNKKTDLWSVFLGFFIQNVKSEVPGNYVGLKIPKPFPLATALVRLLTPSLP